MKARHVTLNFPESYAGMATACKEITEGQSKVGEDVVVVASNLDHLIGVLKKLFSKILYEKGSIVIIFWKCLVPAEEIESRWNLLLNNGYKLSVLISFPREY